jgi:hypothetical protein
MIDGDADVGHEGLAFAHGNWAAASGELNKPACSKPFDKSTSRIAAFSRQLDRSAFRRALDQTPQ